MAQFEIRWNVSSLLFKPLIKPDGASVHTKPYDRMISMYMIKSKTK